MRDRSELTLRKQRDFSRVYNQGKSKGSLFAVVLYKKNGLKYTRTAFVSSKKVGNSVQRSRARRLLKESYRAFEDNIKKGYDIIFVARSSINGHKEYEVEKSLKKTLIKCDLLTDYQYERK